MMIKHFGGSSSVTGHDARQRRSSQVAGNLHYVHSRRHDLRHKFNALRDGISPRQAVRSSSAFPADDDAIAFCLDSAIADISYLTITVAYNAAQELWPGRVVGPIGLYVDKAKTILPALAEPHHAVVLVRLLSDEGVIGARSTAGREGPVVGRAVRNTGSRPLLVAEIAEHWPVVMDSCLVRWSLEEPGRAPQGPWSNNSRNSSGDSGFRSNNSSGGSSRGQLLARTRAAFQAAQTALLEDDGVLEACLSRVTPYSTAVEALKGCSRTPLMLTSTLPASLGLRVLRRCGLTTTATSVPLGLDLIVGPNWAGIVARVIERATAGGGRVQLVTGNLARLEQLVEESGWAEKQAGDAGEAEGSFGSNLVASATSVAAGAGARDGSAEGAQAAAAGTSGGKAYGLARQSGIAAAGPAVRLARVAAIAAAGNAALSSGSPHDGPDPCDRNDDQDVTSSSLRSINHENDEHEPRGEGGARVESSARSAEAGTLSPGRYTDAEIDVRGQLPQETGVVSASASAPVRGPGAVERQQREGPLPSSGGGADAMGAITQTVSACSAVIIHGTTAGARITLTGDREFSVASAQPSPSPSGDAAGQLLGASSGAPGSAGPTAAMSTGLGLSGSMDYIGVGIPGNIDDDNDIVGSYCSPWETLRIVHLAEWSCPNMSFRARALSHQPRTSLLSEHQLAEWLGVTHLDVVMDGVAWR